MSWGHYVYNYKGYDNPLNAELGEFIDFLQVDTSTTASYAQNLRGRLAVSGDGSGLFVSRGDFSSSSKFMTTTDYFQTVSEYNADDIVISGTALPLDNDSFVTEVRYQGGYYYMTTIDLTLARLRYDYYSTDGVNWTNYSVDGGSVSQELPYYGLTLEVDGQRRFAAGRAQQTSNPTNGNSFLPTTGIGNGAGTWSGYANNILVTPATTYDARKIEDVWYIRNVSFQPGGNGKSIIRVNEDASSILSNDINWGPTPSGGRPSGRFSVSDGNRFFIEDATPAEDVVVYYIEEGTNLASPNSLPSITFSYPRQMYGPKFGYTPTLGWIAMAAPFDLSANGEGADLLYIHTSVDGINWNYRGPVRIETDYQDLVGFFPSQIEYAGNGYWYIACNSRQITGSSGTYANRPLLLGLEYGV